MIVALAIIASSFFFLVGSPAPGESVVLPPFIVPFDYYQGGWAAVFCAGIALIAKRVFDLYGVTAAAFLSYLLANAIWTFFWWRNGYESMDELAQFGLRWHSAVSAFSLLLIILPFLDRGVSHKSLLGIGSWMAFSFCIISSVRVVLEFLLSPDLCRGINECGGSLVNPSINSGMIVATLPIAMKRIANTSASVVIFLLAGMAVFFSKSSIAIGMISLFSAALVLRRFSPRLLLVLAGALFGLAAIFGKKEILSTGDRFPLWNILFRSFILHPAHPVKAWTIGSGYGSTGVFIQSLQQHFWWRPRNWWAWVHNDWLELLLSSGVLGLGLGIAVTFLSARSFFTERRFDLLFSLCLMAILSFVNPILHVGLPCVFACWLLACGLKKRDLAY